MPFMLLIEAGIDSLSRGDNLVGMMRAVNHLKFYLLYQVVVARSDKLESWIRAWWGENFNSQIVKDRFEHKGDNLMWSPPPAVSETALELLL